MIRQATNSDIKAINELGLLIEGNYSKLFNIEELLTKDYVNIYVYEENNDIYGFIHLESHYEICDLINIAVRSDMQNHSIGSKLLEYSINNMKADKMMLEVRESNVNAIKLYNKYNFKVINIRKKYYGDENALIMESVKLSKMYIY